MTFVKRKLCDIADLFGGGTPSRASADNFGSFIDWVTPTDLAPIGKVDVLGKTKEGLSEQGLKSCSAKKVPAGSVLFSSRASIGKIAVTDRECATNQGFVNFVPKPEMVDAWYLAYLLCYHIENIAALAGETTFKEVSRGKLRDFEVRIPKELEVQQHIVRWIRLALGHADEIDTLRSQSLKEAAAIDAAMFGDIVESWIGDTKPNPVPLGSILRDVQYGTSSKANNQQDGVPIIRMGNIQNGELNLLDLKHISLNEKELTKYRLNEGDILINRTNSLELVGKAATFGGCEGDWVFASYLIRLVVDTAKAIPAYVTTVINSRIGRKYILDTARRAIGMVNINAQEIRRLPIPLPSVQQQTQIMDKINASKVLSRQLCVELDRRPLEILPKSILRKAFAGEL